MVRRQAQGWHAVDVANPTHQEEEDTVRREALIEGGSVALERVFFACHEDFS